MRASANIFFQIKMGLISLTGVNALGFHFTVYRRVAIWDCEPIPPLRARLAGYFSLLLWSGVVICGRMQAYNWFDKARG